MQKWLDDNDISIHSTHNKGKSVISERFIRTRKSKINKELTTNDSKYCLGYLNKVVDECNNPYHRSFRKPIHTDYSALTEEIESNHKAPKFKVGDGVKITKYKNIFSKHYTRKWSKETFVTNSVLKANPWSYKTHNLNG